MKARTASTVQQYLDALPDEQREIVARVREVILKNLPKGYREAVSWGALTYEVPLELYSDTYNKKPLCYVSLAAHKNHNALHLMGAYAKPAQADALKRAFAKAGKKLDMGKSCVRFKKVEDLPLDAIGEIIADVPPDEMIEYARSAHRK